MLPALTTSRRRLPPRRVLMAALAGAFALLAVIAQLGVERAPAPPLSLARSLHSDTWGIALPTAWLAAPLPRLQSGDLVDVLAVRQGERAYVVPVAYAARVIAVDERGVVIEIDENAAANIASARGSGMLLIPLLRAAP